MRSTQFKFKARNFEFTEKKTLCKCLKNNKILKLNINTYFSELMLVFKTLDFLHLILAKITID